MCMWVLIVGIPQASRCSAGKKMHVTAGVTKAHMGCDLLICRREIAELISDGYTFDVR